MTQDARGPLNGNKKIRTTSIGTLDLGDVVKTADTVPVVANGYNPALSV